MTDRSSISTRSSKRSRRSHLRNSPLSVLVLDDESAVRETLSCMISSLGMKATCAGTLDDFVEAYENDHFDVIVLDLTMPDIDGLRILAELAPTLDCQVIIASGTDRRVLQAARLAAETSGIDVLGILQKPLRRQKLKELLALARPCYKMQYAKKSLVVRPPIDRSMLKAAIDRRDIICHLQPKIRLCDGSPCGFEALARWNDPEHGMIPPDDFIPLASAFGLDFSLSMSMLDQAMECLASLADRSLSVAVNVPVRVCADPRFEHKLADLLSRHSLIAKHVILELTEAGPNSMTSDEISALLRLRLNGHKLSIDDFGTGSSSLERLVRVPFDELKIDRLFVRDIDTSHRARSLIRTVVQMGKLFGMSVTIEGVETPAAIKIVKKLGCDNVQGYGVARPMPPAALHIWLAEHSKTRAKAESVQLL